MSALSKAWKKNAKHIYTEIKKTWDEARVLGIGQSFFDKYGLGGLFRKETYPGSGIYRTTLITPLSIALAGIVGFIGYKVLRKR